MRFENQTFQNDVITLDGNDYIDCTFMNCTFNYSGGEFNLDRIRFDSLQFTVDGPAARTVMMLRSLWTNDVGRRAVLGLLDPPQTGASTQ